MVLTRLPLDPEITQGGVGAPARDHQEFAVLPAGRHVRQQRSELDLQIGSIIRQGARVAQRHVPGAGPDGELPRLAYGGAIGELRPRGEPVRSGRRGNDLRGVVADAVHGGRYRRPAVELHLDRTDRRRAARGDVAAEP